MIVSDALKRRLDTEPKVVIVCEQCAVVGAAAGDVENPVPEADPTCEICASLKAQEEAAAIERARSGDKQTDEKWAHLFRARWAHQFKAHKNDPRGRR